MTVQTVIMTMMVITIMALLLVIGTVIVPGWPGVLLGAGAAVLLFATMTGCLHLTERLEHRRDQRDRQVWGPQLATWLGLSSPADLQDWDLATWREQRRAGVTADQAQLWSDHGLPPALGLSARRDGIPLGQVTGLAQLMASTGAWDGRDRRQLVDLVGARKGFVARWLALPADQVADRLSTPRVVTYRDHRTGQTATNTWPAGREVLHAMETERAGDGGQEAQR